MGFDINTSRVKELQDGQDHTLEVDHNDLKAVINGDLLSVESSGRGLYCTTAVDDIEDFNFYIILFQLRQIRTNDQCLLR